MTTAPPRRRAWRVPGRLLVAACVACVMGVTGTIAAAAEVAGSGLVETCDGRRVELPLAAADASAGVLANAVGRSDSVRWVASRMLTEATDALRRTEPPPGGCPAACGASDPDVVLRSTPLRLLGDSPDAAHCDALHAATTATPFVYERSFATLDAVSDWINALTRGKGADGEDLYRRCDRSCSPQYAWTIRGAVAAELAVRAEVVCGPPRDRDDNAYRLASGLAWSCGGG